jgi:hypothetical protein
MADIFDTIDPTPGYRYDAERGTWVIDRPATVPSAQLEPELRWTPDVAPEPVVVGETSDMCGGCADGDHVNPYAVGSIFHTSWGYDQTNVEFYVVVRETKASVWLDELPSTFRNGREYPAEGWTAVGPGTMHRKGKHGTYVRMDYVRHAYPYTGGGCYSTAASGGAGH